MGIFGKPPDSRPEPAPPPKPAPPPASHAPSATTCVIGAKTTVKGEITGDEDVLIEGSVEGQIRVNKSLRVGSGGSVKATVEAENIVVSGEVQGDLSATQRVEIQASGRVTGNVKAPKIVIAEGAMFKGNSDMSGRRDERKDKVAAS